MAQWTNHRVMEWLRSVDLAEYAPNLRGSGVHGGLMVCNDEKQIKIAINRQSEHFLCVYIGISWEGVNPTGYILYGLCCILEYTIGSDRKSLKGLVTRNTSYRSLWWWCFTDNKICAMKREVCEPTTRLPCAHWMLVVISGRKR